MEPDQDQAAKLRNHSLALAAETSCDPRTAAKWLKGERVAAGNHAALTEAAERIGITRGEADGA